ncbi:PAS domain S-box protein [Desulfobacula sp.]|uniref:PAS domain S-box protein n=1 Tax=Desulfobacula sp. TaxID=2593537 RepID=UPI0026259CC2|nr:PAS domain S-box protein [Desulfobacula sp.]
MDVKPTYEALEQRVQELEKSENKLRESEERFRVAFHTSPDAINLNRISDGMYIDINEGFSRLTGYTRDDIFGKTSLSLDIWENPEDRKRLVDGLSRTGHVENLEARFVRKDRTVGVGLMSARTLQINNEMVILSVTRDITTLKKSEVALRKSEEKFRQIYNNILDVYYEASLDGILLEISPSIEKVSQYKREELIGKSLYEIYTHPGDRDTLIEIILDKEIVKDYELNLTDKNNTQHICSINIELVKDTAGRPLKIVGIFRDISDRKKMEDEKINAQKIANEHEKLALVGQVAGKMAHDFNNVLGIIMGNAELSLLDCKDAETKQTLELIYQQTIRGKNLIKNLVAFAKDQEPKQEFFKINEKIDLVINLLRKDLDGIELITETKPGIPDLLADPGMIEHALVNLIQNAIHATSKADDPMITLRSYCLDNTICFEIQDNGCGIPKEHLTHIFDPSFTLKGNKDVTGSYARGINGTGYGMSNVKKYIELHKGDLSFESKPGSGTTFTICLPIIRKRLTRQEKTDLRKDITCSGKYILLVEDETAISDVQYTVLTQDPCSHKVDIANNGTVAMDLFNRNKYDLISLDHVLPGKTSGMDVYKHIRRTNQTLPILFISGNIEFLESIKGLKQKDVNIAHQSKPCQNKEYVNSINNLLKRRLK